MGKEWLNLHFQPFLDMMAECDEKKRKAKVMDTDRPLKKLRLPPNREELEPEPDGESQPAVLPVNASQQSYAELIKKCIPVKQVHLGTGDILATFSSLTKAQNATGVGRGAIKRVLNFRGEANAGGYFWRFQGQAHGPWLDPEPTNLKPVEQLNWATGDVLETYESLAEAKRKMCMLPNCSGIQLVCDKRGRETAAGFFWRWKGSDSLPKRLTPNRSEVRGTSNVQGTFCVEKKKVDQLCLKTGRVIATFESIGDAARAMGSFSLRPNIGRCCSGRHGYYSAAGFGWRNSKED